jgi:hypothetical protein
VAGAKGRSGGRRPGAGRPRSPGKPAPPPRPPVPPINWKAVREAADAGADEREIIRGLGIPDEALQDPATLAQLRAEITAGHARQKLELRRTIRNRGLKTLKGAGSVNALALQARNVLEWDKELPTQEVEPDLGTARQRLRDLLVKLAQARTEVEGRKVTPLELLHREAQADRSQPGRRS